MPLAPADILSRLAHALKDRLAWPIQRLRDEASGSHELALIVLIVLLFFAIRTIRGSRLAALALLPLSAAWLVFNSPLEGPTLLVISPSHGVTAADMISVFCVGLSAWRLVPVVTHPLR
jgi:hypothetical protein